VLYLLAALAKVGTPKSAATEVAGHQVVICLESAINLAAILLCGTVVVGDGVGVVVVGDGVGVGVVLGVGDGVTVGDGVGVTVGDGVGVGVVLPY